MQRIFLKNPPHSILVSVGITVTKADVRIGAFLAMLTTLVTFFTTYLPDDTSKINLNDIEW